MPKVSVIIPVYNCEGYIEKCARSLFEQSLEGVEYIFINDCTKDSSIEILENVVSCYRDREVLIINNDTNIGPGPSRNAGIRAAQGEYIIFCDSDDFVESDAYENMYLLAKQKDADVVACGIGYYDENGECLFSELYHTNEITKESLYDLKRLEGGIHSSSCNKLVKRDFLLQHSILFANGVVMWDDLFVTILYRFFANRMCVIDKPYYHYIMHPNSITHESILKQTDSQILCARLISDYFVGMEIDERLKRSLMFLKFKSKSALYKKDTLRRWLSLFPESHRYIWSFRDYCGTKFAIGRIFVANLGLFGWNCITILGRIKRLFIMSFHKL